MTISSLLKRLPVGLLALLVWPMCASVFPQAVPAAMAGGYDEGDAQTMGWGSRVRSQLERHGVAGVVSVTNDWSISLQGGKLASRSFNRFLVDASVALDTRKLGDWGHGTMFVRVQSYKGENGQDYVGDVQGFSNIDSAPHTELYEAWLEQSGADELFRVRVGKVDANTLFDVVENGADFLHSSMGHSPTILYMPTYPDPQPSINVLAGGRAMSMAIGVYKTNGSPVLLIFEGGGRFSFRRGDTRFGVGFWEATGKVPSIDGSLVGSTFGEYMVQEVNIRLRDHPGGIQESLGAFVQLGNASSEMSLFTAHVGGGLVWHAPFGHKTFEVGTGTSIAALSHYRGSCFYYNGEAALESFLKIKLRPYLELIPDVQWIQHPGGVEGRGNALVFTPRIHFSL